jgi:hypothetical protein
MASLKEKARATWEEMKDDPPGQRFQRHYRRRQREQSGRGRLKRGAVCAALIAVGVVLMFIPGPAVVMYALAGAVLAEDSLRVARALDWTELRLRSLVRWALRVWKRAGTAARAGIVLLALGAASAGAYGVYWFWFER